jgi:Xaa-Pro aminopeptidase
MDEFQRKQEQIKALLEKHGLKALLLQKNSSFAWATCGAASYINTASTTGEASLLVTNSGRYLITNNIEAPRFEKEEGLKAQGWEFRIGPWYQANKAVEELGLSQSLGADILYPGATDLSLEMARLRANLLPEEQERYRKLCRLTAEAMNTAIRSVHPGQTEYELAAVLADEVQRREVQPIVVLIATDERIFNFRHPLPTSKKLERYAMLIVCGRWKGLVSSITRFVYFGRLTDEIRRKAEATARVDAAFIQGTRPGLTLAEVLAKGRAAYAEVGYPDEWKLHHQGGPGGYEPREFIATPDSREMVALGQAYAWNPSITGTKSEDTILVQPDGNEVMTEIAGWPSIPVTVEGKTVLRPGILEIL